MLSFHMLGFLRDKLTERRLCSALTEIENSGSLNRQLRLDRLVHICFGLRHDRLQLLEKILLAGVSVGARVRLFLEK